MTSEGHLLFSIACAIFAKKTELTLILAQSDWWHIIPSAALTCLLPDIDHPKSFIGQRLKWISKIIFKAIGHRSFTHSFLVIFFIMTLFYFLKKLNNWIISADIAQGMLLGYISHIFADMLTPFGVPLLWPLRWRFRLPIINTYKYNKIERIFCIILLAFAIWIPKTSLGLFDLLVIDTN